MKITRDVISDLWPLYAAGEATPDTRVLVEEFLAQDQEFARTLRNSLDMPAAGSSLSPDSEARALERTRDLIGGGGWLRGARLVALTLTILAIIRLGSDDSETIWGRVFVAGAAWIVYLGLLYRARRRALRATMPQRDG